MPSLTASNAGDRVSAATTLRWHRSTGATITTTDTAVGTDSDRLLERAPDELTALFGSQV